MFSAHTSCCLIGVQIITCMRVHTGYLHNNIRDVKSIYLSLRGTNFQCGNTKMAFFAKLFLALDTQKHNQISFPWLVNFKQLEASLSGDLNLIIHHYFCL